MMSTYYFKLNRKSQIFDFFYSTKKQTPLNIISTHPQKRLPLALQLHNYFEFCIRIALLTIIIIN